jgi:sortase A
MSKGKIVLLAAGITTAAILGTWLMLFPAIEKRDNLDKQAELTASIAAGETLTAASIGFYDEPAKTTETPVKTEPFIEPDTTMPELIAEPEPAAPDETEVAVEHITNPVTEAADENSMTGIGILTIDKIALMLPVVDGVSDEQLKIAVGRVPQTAAIGEIGNAVIAGHRSYTYGDYFNRLGEVETGDIIGYTPKDGEPMRFEVFEVIEIQPGDQIAFIQPENESIITLYTCTPVRKATQRLLVRAKKI